MDTLCFNFDHTTFEPSPSSSYCAEIFYQHMTSRIIKSKQLSICTNCFQVFSLKHLKKLVCPMKQGVEQEEGQESD